MRKLAVFLFAAVTALVISTGTANADRAFWYTNNTSQTWDTFFNITNTDTSATVTATVKVYAGTGLDGGTLLGSTTRTLVPGAYWNFGTNAAVDTTSLTTNTFNANTRGTVVITGSTTGKILGWSTVLNSSTSSGFSFRIGSDSTAE